MLIISLSCFALAAVFEYVKKRNELTRLEETTKALLIDYKVTLEQFLEHAIIEQDQCLNHQIIGELIQRASDPDLFQFRVIRSDGEEMYKYDEYGFDNFNNVSTRPYWESAIATSPGNWSTSDATPNWENDSISGEVITTAASTIRIFYRYPDTLMGMQQPLLAFNLKFDTFIEKAGKFFPNVEITLGSKWREREIKKTPAFLSSPIVLELDGKAHTIGRTHAHFNVPIFLLQGVLYSAVLLTIYLLSYGPQHGRKVKEDAPNEHLK